MGTTVQRLPADKPGDTIVSAVLTTTDSQLERGSYEVNTNDRDRVTVAGDVIDSDFLQPGTMHGIDIKGTRKNGLLTNYSYTLSTSPNNININSEVSLETIK